MRRCVFVLCLSLAAATAARAQAPAARLGDPTSHGGQVSGPGVPTVLIGGRPAAVLGDWTTCPLSSGPSNEVPHVGGPIVSGSATVLIGGKRAARAGDSNAENQASATIQTGAPNVTIGP